jgi:hypothetical protein
MALDPTISLQAGQGVTPIANPMDIMGKAQALQGGQLQLQQQKMAMQDEQTMRRLAQSGQYQTPDAMANAAMEAGVSPKTVLAYKMQGADYQSKVASTAQALATAAMRGGAAQKTKIDLTNEQAAKARALALTAPDTASYQAGLSQLDQQYASLGVPSLLQKYGNDTPQNRALLATNGATLNDAHAAAFGQTMSTPTGVVNVKQPLAPGSAPTVTPLTQNPVSDLGKLASDMGLQPNDPRVTAKFKELHPNVLNFMGPNGLPRSTSGPGAGPTPGQATPGDLSGIPSQWQSTIKALGSYNILLNDFPARPGPGQLSKAQALQMLTQAYPNYSVADAKTNYDFINSLKGTTPASAGGVIFNAGKMLGHAAELADLSQKIGNSSNLVGHIGDVIAGPATQTTPLAGQWNFMRGKLMDEANKLAVGGVPDAKSLAEDVSNMKMTDRLDKQLAIIQQVVNMGMESVKGIRDKRDNIMGANSPGDSMLSQDSLNNIAKVYKYVGQSPPDLGAAAGGKGYTATAQATSPRNPQSVTQPQTVSLADIKEAVKPGGQYAGKTVQQVVDALTKRGIKVP